ncbi:MAG TPA: VTT domain-containing protein [Usitatibacter sp.]|jgi:membrane protein DedA with SNARE-associated domain/rhodanese-related sulfurtransferase
MDLLELLTRWDVALVFAAALSEQAGLPVPAAPILVAAGALVQAGGLRPEAVLGAAIAACLIADHIWFIAGRKFGRGLLAGVCRLSLSPDTCVQRTDDLIAHHGAPLLMVAKFIPGVSAVSIPTAAAMGLSYRRFLLYDLMGCLIWSGAYVGAGMIFGREVRRALDAMAQIGGWSLVVIAALFVVYIGLKLAQRRRLRRLYRLVRIAPSEVAEILARSDDLLILDARSRLARVDDPRVLPASISFGLEDHFDLLPRQAHQMLIITFCTCPNEASAALLAERLLKAGYSRVRVLTGGAEAVDVLAAEVRD